MVIIVAVTIIVIVLITMIVITIIVLIITIHIHCCLGTLRWYLEVKKTFRHHQIFVYPGVDFIIQIILFSPHIGTMSMIYPTLSQVYPIPWCNSSILHKSANGKPISGCIVSEGIQFFEFVFLEPGMIVGLCHVISTEDNWASNALNNLPYLIVAWCWPFMETLRFRDVLVEPQKPWWNMINPYTKPLCSSWFMIIFPHMVSNCHFGWLNSIFSLRS